jgi:hypothetical protein
MEIWLTGEAFIRQRNLRIQDQRRRRGSASLASFEAGLKGGAPVEFSKLNHAVSFVEFGAGNGGDMWPRTTAEFLISFDSTGNQNLAIIQHRGLVLCSVCLETSSCDRN